MNADFSASPSPPSPDVSSCGEDEVETRISAVFGSVSAGWVSLRSRDPEFAAAFLGYVEAAHHTHHLPDHVRELLLLAHDASMTTVDEAGIEHRMVTALRAGATERHILDVLELLTMLSIHSIVRGIHLVDKPEPPPANKQGRYWVEFEQRFPGFHGTFARCLPALFAKYDELGKVLWRQGGLEPEWKELVFVVADLSTNHLFTDGAALHVVNAKAYGATNQQIVEAIGLAIVPVARTVDVGLPALARALDSVAAQL